MNTKKMVAVALRVCMGFIFLWAFSDKLLGLGFSTCKDATAGTTTYFCEKAWIHGGSPTAGFLLHGTHGPLAGMFQALAGNIVVDWLFMAGLFGVGLALMLGRYMKLAVVSGSIMLGLMYLAALPPATNPILDDHIIYILTLVLLLFV